MHIDQVPQRSPLLPDVLQIGPVMSGDYRSWSLLMPGHICSRTRTNTLAPTHPAIALGNVPRGTQEGECQQEAY